MNVKVKMHQYVIFMKLQNFDTADIMCFTVAEKKWLAVQSIHRHKPSIYTMPYLFQLVERQQMKLEEQKEENVEITQELRLTRLVIIPDVLRTCNLQSLRSLQLLLVQ